MDFQIFVAPLPYGDDSNDGLTEKSSVNTLNRANRLCHEHVPEHDRNIQVVVAPGLYQDQTVKWDYYSPQFDVKIVGTDRGLPTTAQEMPEFRGPAGGQTWLGLPNTRISERANLQIRGLFVNRYRTAISTEGSNGNVISGCYFRRIGQQSDDDKVSTATIRLVNSNYNRIELCYFRINGNFFSNNESEWRLFHGVYMAHHSNENIVERNNFSRFSGHPVKVRDSSNYNEVRRNRFFNVRSGTALQDYYKASPRKEAPSFGNIFAENEVLPNGDNNLIAVEIWRRVFDCREIQRQKHRVLIENNFGNPRANEVIFQ